MSNHKIQSIEKIKIQVRKILNILICIHVLLLFKQVFTFWFKKIFIIQFSVM